MKLSIIKITVNQLTSDIVLNIDTRKSFIFLGIR